MRGQRLTAMIPLVVALLVGLPGADDGLPVADEGTSFSQGTDPEVPDKHDFLCQGTNSEDPINEV